MEDDLKYQRARKRVEDLKGFYGHLATYVIVNTGLAILNFLTSPNSLWFYWPMLGWGIGLAFHAVGVFITPNIGKDWEEKKIRELMEKDKHNNTL